MHNVSALSQVAMYFFSTYQETLKIDLLIEIRFKMTLKIQISKKTHSDICRRSGTISYLLSSLNDEIRERFFPCVHLDDLYAGNYFVHESYALVRPYGGF